MNEERLKTWQLAVKRQQRAQRTLAAAIAAWDGSGPSTTSAWGAVTAAREAYLAMCTQEEHCWKVLGEPENQTRMELEDEDPPRGARPAGAASPGLAPVTPLRTSEPPVDPPPRGRGGRRPRPGDTKH